MNEPKLCKIDPKKVARVMLEFPIPVIAGHLDLEGFCYLKVVRTGPQELFVSDVTQRVLTHDSDDVGKPMTLEEIEKTFWRHPAMRKWASKDNERKEDGFVGRK